MTAPMAAILFVHGTGVREPSYVATCAVISQALEHFGINRDLRPCLWGDALGAKQPKLSVPDQTLQARPDRFTPDQEYARWELLYRDPLFELRLLKSKPAPSGPLAPAALAAADRAWSRIERYNPSAAALEILKDAKLNVYWDVAWRSVIVEDSSAKEALKASPTELGEPGQAIARAVIAQLLACAFLDDVPLLDGGARDRLARLLVDEWDLAVAGVGTWLLGFVGDLAASAATPIVRHNRGAITIAAGPASGDVLLYQARGKPIRDFIDRTITEAGDDVVLLAHSLGGIACVDLFVMQPMPKVKALVTVGSQAPFLHEIGALCSLEPGQALPTHFPKWLNVYDPYDFLSYAAARVFPSATDLRVESGQPFPQSHSAYWANPVVWEAVRGFLA